MIIIIIIVWIKYNNKNQFFSAWIGSKVEDTSFRALICYDNEADDVNYYSLWLALIF